MDREQIQTLISSIKSENSCSGKPSTSNDKYHFDNRRAVTDSNSPQNGQNSSQNEHSIQFGVLERMPDNQAVVTTDVRQEGETLGEIYHLTASDYQDLTIEQMGFSNRVKNRFHWAKKPILTLEDLLGCTHEDLLGIPSFGATCLNEVKNALIGLTENQVQKTFGEIYQLQPQDYCDINVSDYEFSVRVLTCFKRSKKPIETFEDLLSCTPEQLLEIRNFGKTSLDDVERVLDLFRKTNGVLDSTSNCRPSYGAKIDDSLIRSHKEEIARGDFGFCADLDLDEETDLLIGKFKEAFELIDKELIYAAYNNRDHISNVLTFLSEEASIYTKQLSIKSILHNAMECLPIERHQDRVEGFINAYSYSEEIRQSLRNYIHSNNIERFSDITSRIGNGGSYLRGFVEFLKWCSFDLQADIDAVQQALFRDERSEIILTMRAAGETLESVGKTLGITRERVRQLEKKAKSKGSTQLRRKKIINKIYALRNQDEVLTPTELEEYFGQYTPVFLDLLKTTESPSYEYDKDLDVFIVENGGLAERVQSYLDTLPDSFNIERVGTLIDQGVDEYELNREIIETAINRVYKLSGSIYHRFKLTLAKVYEAVLRKYYPTGLWIYGDKEIKEFREHVFENYGDVGLPENNRALRARISAVGILCDRGTYKAKEEHYISRKLANRLRDYIEHNPQIIIMTNTLISVFEEDLRNEGVDNKYYLQGILHELFGNRWFFRRDYISKDPNVTSIYTEVINFVKSSSYPVNRKQLKTRFPGVTDVVLNFALADSSILNLFGEYYHTSKLSIPSALLEQISIVIDKLLTEQKAVHCAVIYNELSNSDRDLLENNYIKYPFSLFSLLAYEFPDKYAFSRPFVAKDEESLNGIGNALQEIIKDSDEISIVDIREFANKHQFRLVSILELINSCNDTHFFADSSNVVSIQLTGIDELVAKEVEQIIIVDLQDKGTIPIADLTCIGSFPAIEVSWTEWLIYSTMKRWGTQVEVGTSSSQLRYSVPLIAMKGKYDSTEYEGLSVESAGELVAPDNLEDIDDLVLDYINDEMEF